MALAAYQRIVADYFPNFRHDLHHSAWWPYKLVGQITTAEMNATDLKFSARNSSISYRCEPVASEKDAVVILERGADEYWGLRGNFDALEAVVAQMRPNASPYYWGCTTALNFQETHPATSLVKDWLISDLKSAGWPG